MNGTPSIGLEKKGRWDVGRDPREMTRAELELLGHANGEIVR
ncbi:MAG: hypothetical protein RKK15_09145 [Defluviicoccus sp.]|nr:hypothetical protein [Defluviicoccus sp.]